MLKNYLLIAFRNFSRHKSFTTIIIGGLAIALCCCLLITLWIQDEISYDRFHENLNNIYRITGKYNLGGNEPTYSPYTNYNTALSFKETFPEIVSAARLGPHGGTIIHGDNTIPEINSCLADQEIFEIFSLNMIKGNKESALSEPNTLVITDEIAKTHFTDVNPLGQTVEYNGIAVTITGIIESIPENSHFHFDYFLSMSTADQIYSDPTLNNWSSLSQLTYILVSPGTNIDLMKEKRMTDYLNKYYGNQQAEDYDYFFQPLKDIHLKSHLSGELEANGDIKHVWIFGTVALVILLFACINYISLITVKSIRRAKEVGIRKVSGAGKNNLISQFLWESILSTLISFILAIVITALILPYFNQFFSKSLTLDFNNNIYLWLSSFSVVILLGVITGIYPAFILSSFKPVESLKGSNERLFKNNFSALLSRSLLILQFVISIALLISIGVILNQVNYMKSAELGFNHEHVLQIYAGESYNNGNYDSFKAELLKNPSITSVGGANQTSGREAGNWRQFSIVGRDDTSEEVLPIMIVDHDFFSTLQVHFEAGRNFSTDFSTDVQNAYIMNKTAARKYGLDNPVGTRINSWIMSNEGNWNLKQGELVGVVKDYHLTSLQKEIQPVLYYLHSPQTSNISIMMIRINENNISETLSYIESISRKYQPEVPFNYSFLEDNMNQWYQQEERFLQLLLTFVVIAIIIAIMGVYGLSGYAVQQRTKEIGIRKVMGASPIQIIRLISNKYLLNLAIANLIAWPIGFYLMRNWLQNFAFRINLSIIHFLFAGLLTCFVAILTISFQTWKTANGNPVKSLRWE